jgi:hypothetical protein
MPQNQTDPKLSADMDIDFPEGVEETTPSTESQPAEQTSQGQAITPQTTETPTQTQSATAPQSGKDGQGTSDAGEDDSPRFKERVNSIVAKEREKLQKEFEDKYGKAANNWAAINEIAQKKPEVALTIIKEMEEAGFAEKGTYENAKAIIEKQNAQAPANQQPQTQTQQTAVLDPETQKVVDFAKSLLTEKEKAQATEIEKQENVLQTFESRHPEIAQSKSPESTRRLIGLQAQKELDEGRAKDFSEALEIAARWVLHRDDLLKEYKEKGEINGIIRSAQDANSVPLSGGVSASGGSHRALDAEEREAMKTLGFKDEGEYLKYLDGNSGMVD